MASQRRSTFAEDKAFEERFRPCVQKILHDVVANNLLGKPYVAPEIDDFRHNKDWGLVVDLQSLDRLNQLGFASRIRRAEQKAKRNNLGHRFTREFTVRATRPSGFETEAHKVRVGYGALMLYGFEAEPGSALLDPWMMINLDRLREWQSGQRRWREHKSNSNGDSTFYTYWIEDLPDRAIMDSQGIPYALIGATERAKIDPRFAPYTKFDDWAETTRVHPDLTAPGGWICPECEGRSDLLYGQTNNYDPTTRLYVGGDTLRCLACAVKEGAWTG